MSIQHTCCQWGLYCSNPQSTIRRHKCSKTFLFNSYAFSQFE
nr:MAG TPA: hypothetical protein [Caudoviricetes sp.]